VRALNRIELVGEAMRHVLNSLAVVAPYLAAGGEPSGLAGPLCAAGGG
jgi:hypothetical protein